MGKGDIKSKKGKIANGSYGKKRKHKVKKATIPIPKAKKVTEKVELEEKVVKKTKKTTKKTVKKTKDADTSTEE